MKILFTPYGGGSIAHIVRSLALADVLKSRGHDLLFTSPTTKKGFIEKAGYPVFGQGHPEVNLNDETEQGTAYFQKNRRLFVEWLGDEIKAAKQFLPDIIVNSPTFFGPQVHRKLGIRHISVVNAQWLMQFRGLLGLGRSTQLPHHAALRTLAKPIFAKRFDEVYMTEIKKFYADLEIKDIPQKRADLHARNPILIPGIPEFEPIERSQRSDIHYIGPLFWQGFERQPFEPTQYFPDFGQKPFIYVSLGGSIYRKKSYEELIAALAKKTDWNILLSLGPNFPREAFPHNLPHLVIAPFVPGLKVCKYADVLINTASHGTVMQALWWGKPIIALPHNIDQATIAARLEELGIGVNLNKIGLRDFFLLERYFQRATQIPWQQIIEKTEQVLHNKGMHRRAERLQQQLHRYDHADQRGADLIEQYASV